MHEFDELRFDIRGHECTYFLRASSVEEKDSWAEAIERNKVRNQPEQSPAIVVVMVKSVCVWALCMYMRSICDVLSRKGAKK